MLIDVEHNLPIEGGSDELLEDLNPCQQAPEHATFSFPKSNSTLEAHPFKFPMVTDGQNLPGFAKLDVCAASDGA